MHKAHHVHFYPFAKITGIALNEIDQCFSTYEPRGASNVARHQRLHSPWPMGGGWRQSLSRFSGETKLPSLQRECPTFMTRMPEKILLPDPPPFLAVGAFSTPLRSIFWAIPVHQAQCRTIGLALWFRSEGMQLYMHIGEKWLQGLVLQPEGSQREGSSNKSVG